jgi:hypothetical protein
MQQGAGNDLIVQILVVHWKFLSSVGQVGWVFAAAADADATAAAAVAAAEAVAVAVTAVYRRPCVPGDARTSTAFACTFVRTYTPASFSCSPLRHRRATVTASLLPVATAAASFAAEATAAAIDLFARSFASSGCHLPRKSCTWKCLWTSYPIDCC